MKLYWPIAHPGVDEPAMSQQFGQTYLDYSQFGLKGHNGIDFPAPLGTPIHAVADGWIIEQTARDTGFGLRITQLLKDGERNFLAVYGHMERLAEPADVPYDFGNRLRPVKAGQVIGYVDSTGFSTGNHLHLGIYPVDANGNKLYPTNGYGGAIDPLPYLRAKEEMANQTKVVLSKDGKTVYLATPVATDFENFKKQAAVEGIEVPKPIPPASTL